MLQLIVGLVLFLGTHSIAIVRPRWRTQMIERFGELPWKLGYGAISVLGLALIVLGYGAARATDPVLLYQPPMWLRHVSLLLMLPAFTLVLAAYLPGRIQRAVQHPMLLAVKIWATAHLLANGTLADLLLFGGFLAWAVADRISLKRRPEPSVPRAPAAKWNDLIAVAGGLVVYVAFILFLHRWLFGVSPVA
jgi:Predicted membrane protein